MADERKSWAAMSADALREGAILVLVFGLLDEYMFATDGPSGTAPARFRPQSRRAGVMLSSRA
jgi:hypothetical protein